MAQAEGGMTDSIGGDLDHILEERDSPRNKSRCVPGGVGQVLEMTVPGERHEQV